MMDVFHVVILNVQKLEFTAGDDSHPNTPTVSISIENVQDKLHQLLVKENSDNESIFDWIEV
jgi:hypothetical protein